MTFTRSAKFWTSLYDPPLKRADRWMLYRGEPRRDGGLSPGGTQACQSRWHHDVLLRATRRYVWLNTTNAKGQFMKRTFAAALAALAIVTLAGCSSSTPTSEPVQTVTLPPAPSNLATSCIPVETEMGRSLISKATAGSGLQYVRAAAVKSPAFARVYFIAVEFSVPGGSNQVAVFATSALTPIGAPVFAVDDVAQQVTTWPHGDTSKAVISKADPYVAAAKACLK